MEVAFLVEALGRSGGMGVIRRHARHLIDHEGARAHLVVTRGPAPAEDAGIPVHALGAAPAVDVAVATWWTTAEHLWDVRAARRAVFLQGFEHRFYRRDDLADRLGALGVLALPVDYVVIASHMAELLGELRPDARTHLVPNTIDKAVFAERPARAGGGPLRVLVEGQPTLWFKGVPEAVAAVRGMREPATVTLAVHDPGDAAGVEADRVVGALDAAGMAALYAEHDVLLKLSRHEGFGLPVLEAFHVGLPCVLTPFTGSEDLARHEDNALFVPFDDPAAAGAALDRVARDGELRARLRAGALATAAAWPHAREGSARFAAAMRAIAAAEPPDPAPALRAMAHGRRLFVEETRLAQVRTQQARDAAAQWQSAYAHADAQNAEYDRWTRELQRRIAALQARPGFRVEERLRRLGRR